MQKNYFFQHPHCILGATSLLLNLSSYVKREHDEEVTYGEKNDVGRNEKGLSG